MYNLFCGSVGSDVSHSILCWSSGECWILVVVELKYVLRDVSNITLIWHFSMLGMHVRLIYLRNTFS